MSTDSHPTVVFIVMVGGPARPHEVKRLGEYPTVIRVRTGSATVEVAARGEDAEPLLGPYRTPAGAAVGATSTPIAVAASGGRH